MSDTITQYAEAKKAAEDARAALEARLAALMEEAGQIRELLGRRRPKKSATAKATRTRKPKPAETTEAA